MISGPVSTRRQYAIATLVVMTGIAPLTSLIHGLFRASMVAAVCLSLAFVLCIRVEDGTNGRSYRLPVRAHPVITIPLAVLWGLFALTTLLNPSTAGLRRLPAYVFSSVVYAFVLPAALSREHTFRTLAVAGGVLTLIALPTTVIGTTAIGPIILSTNQNHLYPLLGLFPIRNPASIFRQPNPLAFLATIGLMSSFVAFCRTRSTRERTIFLIVAVICAAGVRVTYSQAMWVALAAVTSLYVVYRLSGRDRRALAGATAVGVLFASVGIAALAGIFPEPFALSVELGERGAGWEAAIEAASQRPFVGWGPGNAAAAVKRVSSIDAELTGSSYFRMFAIAGFIGGIVYLALCAGAISLALSRIEPGNDSGFLTLAFLVVVMIAQAFQGLTLFGFALLSVIGMLFVGFAQPATAERTIQLSASVDRWFSGD